MMARDLSFYKLDTEDTLNELCVRASTGWVHIVQGHCNEKNMVLGEITLKSYGDVQDLHYLLGKILERVEVE